MTTSTTTTATTTDVALAALAALITKHGPCLAIRVSSAQASGAAKKYAYWGAVRYRISLAKDGTPCARPLGRASSDRRSLRLAEQDADAAARSLGAVRLQTIGRLSDYDAANVLDQLAELAHGEAA
jgi:hypothetical protein